MKRLYTRLLFIFTVLAAFLVTDCWKAEPHKTPWEVEEQAYLSYEEYFSQQRLYDYAEDVFSGWSLQDADISYDGTVLRLTDSKGTPMRDIATLKGYLFQTADKNWIYGISEASELVRVSYSGKIETLFADRTGLLRSLAEKESIWRTDARSFSSQGQTRVSGSIGYICRTSKPMYSILQSLAMRCG